MQASSEALKAKCLLAFFRYQSPYNARLFKKTQKNLVRIYFFHNFAEPLTQINHY